MEGGVRVQPNVNDSLADCVKSSRPLLSLNIEGFGESVSVGEFGEIQATSGKFGKIQWNKARLGMNSTQWEFGRAFRGVSGRCRDFPGKSGTGTVWGRRDMVRRSTSLAFRIAKVSPQYCLPSAPWTHTNHNVSVSHDSQREIVLV